MRLTCGFTFTLINFQTKVLVELNSLRSQSLSYEPFALSTMLKLKVRKQLWDYINDNRLLQTEVETLLIFHHIDWLLPLLYFQVSIYWKYNGFLQYLFWCYHTFHKALILFKLSTKNLIYQNHLRQNKLLFLTFGIFIKLIEIYNKKFQKCLKK